MLDPFGGALNVALGYYLKLPTPQLKGDANTAAHGLFFDARGGMKLVELPEETLTLGEGPSAVTPFFTGSAGLRLRLPTFLDRLSRGRAGAAELAAVLATTGIVDRGTSALFSRTGALAPLPTRIHSLQVSLGIELDKVANIAISGNLWSNTDLKKRVVVELNLVQPK